MTNPYLTQADLDAFRAEVSAALHAMNYHGCMTTPAIDAELTLRLPPPPKPKPDLLNRYEWELIAGMNESGLIILSSVVGGNLLNLAAAIVSGEVDLPTWREK